MRHAAVVAPPIWYAIGTRTWRTHRGHPHGRTKPLCTHLSRWRGCTTAARCLRRAVHERRHRRRCRRLAPGQHVPVTVKSEYSRRMPCPRRNRFDVHARDQEGVMCEWRSPCNVTRGRPEASISRCTVALTVSGCQAAPDGLVNARPVSFQPGPASKRHSFCAFSCRRSTLDAVDATTDKPPPPKPPEDYGAEAEAAEW